LAAKVQTRRGRWSDRTTVVTTNCRSGQRKREIVSFVDWKIVDALLVDRGRDSGLRRLHDFRCRIGNCNALADRSRLERDVVELGGLSDRDRHFRHDGFFEIGGFDGYLVVAGWNVDDAKEPFVVRGCRAREVRARIASGHRRIRYDGACRVSYGALQVGSVRLRLPESDVGGQN